MSLIYKNYLDISNKVKCAVIILYSIYQLDLHLHIISMCKQQQQEIHKYCYCCTCIWLNNYGQLFLQMFWAAALHAYIPLPLLSRGGSISEKFRLHGFVNTGNIGDFVMSKIKLDFVDVFVYFMESLICFKFCEKSF